jgi:predicted nucleic-acid-binding Zn-ribbon protein
MKILKPGEVKPEIPKQDTCPKCGCVFEYLRDDVRIRQFHGFIPSALDNRPLVFVTCPQKKCGNEMQA